MSEPQRSEVQRSDDAAFPSPHGHEHFPGHTYPASLEELIVQVQWLSHRVNRLEGALQQVSYQQSLPNLRKVQYKINRLYVRELTGTLNIGVTSIGNGYALQTAPENYAGDGYGRDLEDAAEEDWFADDPTW